MGLQFMDFRISMGLFPYFTEIIGKNIAWDFRSRISSKISARTSASASKISACCGPLMATQESNEKTNFTGS